MNVQTTNVRWAVPLSVRNGPNACFCKLPRPSAFPLASRIIVKNLGSSVSESTLRTEFSNFGEIAEVKLVRNEGIKTKQPKAHAFIQYTSQDEAILALENMDGQVFDGRLIFVDVAKPGRDCFGGYPIASGPPPHQNEVADCWY